MGKPCLHVVMVLTISIVTIGTIPIICACGQTLNIPLADSRMVNAPNPADSDRPLPISVDVLFGRRVFLRMEDPALVMFTAINRQKNQAANKKTRLP